MAVVPFQPTTRWNPDPVLIDATIAGRVHGRTLDPEIRAWLVAVLTHRHHTTDEIAAWLHCSRRTIQTVRAEPVAVLTASLLTAQDAADQAGRRAKHATEPSLLEVIRDRDRYRDQRNQLIDQLDQARRQVPDCPPQVVIMRPTHTPRRPRVVCPTLPLFEIGETA